MLSLTPSRFLLSAFIWGAAAGGALSACEPDTVSVKGDWGQADFRVEIADDAGERAQGLMNRESMPVMAGMLFVYDQAQPVSFWMRNTLIPLDIIFVHADGRIARIHDNATPLDETPIPGGDRIFAVLEINGGMADRIGIQPGNTIRHPSFAPATSAWPCDDGLE